MKIDVDKLLSLIKETILINIDDLLIETDNSNIEKEVNNNSLEQLLLNFTKPFQKAVSIVSINEGGWNDVTHDRGGETIFGVARNFHPNWNGWVFVDEMANQFGRGSSKFIEKVDNDINLKYQSILYFKSQFWDNSSCDDLPENIAILVYDMNINSGVSVGQKYLQRTLNEFLSNKISEDGKIGPKTLTALSSIMNYKSEIEIINKYIELRYKFYKQIIIKKPTQQKFWKGWVNRLKFIGNQLLGHAPSFLKY